jgi:hypothetical protein
MSEIQRTWSYLESLFIASEEVKKELPGKGVALVQESVIRLVMKYSHFLHM